MKIYLWFKRNPLIVICMIAVLVILLLNPKEIGLCLWAVFLLIVGQYWDEIGSFFKRMRSKP